MGSGRRDYTGGSISEVGSGGRYTECFLRNFSDQIDAVSLLEIFTYTVPAGSRLSICRIDISCDPAAINRLYIYLGDAGQIIHHFDCHFEFVISDVSPLYLFAGELLRVKIFNSDVVEGSFFGTLYGVLETIS